MNLENRGRPAGFGEDYREGDFEETPVTEAPKSARDDKMHRILSELSSLKSNVAAATASAPAPVQAPQPAYANDALLAELTRLREESARAQTSQEINTQVSRLKDDLVRELKSAPAQDTALLNEIRRLTERVDGLDRRGRVTPVREPVEKTDVQNETYTSSARAANTDDRMTMKTVDDINSKLFSLDRRLSELSVMTLANDITPVAKDIQSLRQDMERGVDGLAWGDIGDKILDELVVVQNSVEDVKRALEEISQAEPFEDNETAVQETIFTAKQRDQIDELRETLENGLQSLNEQIADLHADIKIYAEEGAFAPQTSDGVPAPRISAGALELSDRRFDALAAQLDDVKIQLASNIQSLSHDRSGSTETGAETVADGVDRDGLVLDALAEVRYRLDQLETPEAAAAVADRTDEVLSAIETLRAFTSGYADQSATPTDFTAVLERIDALEERVRPDLVPILNTVAEMRTDSDLAPILDAIRDLPKQNDDAVVSALSAVRETLERMVRNESAVPEIDFSDIETAIAQTRAELLAKHDDHTDVLSAVESLRQEINSKSTAPGIDFSGIETAIAQTRAELLAKRDDHADVLSAVESLRQEISSKSTAPEIDFSGIETAIAQTRAELLAKRDDHADVLSAVESLRQEITYRSTTPAASTAAYDREIPDKVDALRCELRAIAAEDHGRAEILSSVNALKRELEAIKLDRRAREELESRREALAEDRIRLMIREEITRAFASFSVQNSPTAAPQESPRDPLSAVSAPTQALQPILAHLEQKPAPAKPAARVSSAKVVDHTSMKKTPIKVEPPKKKSAPKQAKAAAKIELSPGDAIANQIAHKIALQQLLEAGTDKIGKGRSKRVLDRVRAEQAKELTFEADDSSIRRNFNRQVLVRLLEESEQN